jgi:hypothetical protein
MSKAGPKVWREGRDIDSGHTGPFWFVPNDRRVAIVSGKGELTGQFVLLGMDEDVQSRIAQTLHGRTRFGRLEDAQRSAEAFFAANPEDDHHDEGGEG